VVRRAPALDTKRHLGVSGRYPELLALPDRWVSWWISAVPAGLMLIGKHKPDVLWSTFPIATAHLICLALKRVTGLPWVADFRDPMLQHSYPKSPRQRKVFAWIEGRAVRHCDRAVFTTHGAMESYRKRFPQLPPEKFVVIENGYDEEAFAGIGGAAPGTQVNGCITLLHSGLLYSEGRDPSAFFDAIAKLKNAGTIANGALKVVLRAPGEIAYFHELIKKRGVEDFVAIEPAIPYAEALREMLAADGLLIFQGSSFNTQIPAKIYEYFRARRPIFGLLDSAGETARMLGNAGFNDIAPMESADQIAAALERFLAQIRTGEAHFASEDLVAASSRAHRARQLAGIFDQLSNGKDAA
jgi:glycosyltransferase involved in cell wall biosynthesis